MSKIQNDCVRLVCPSAASEEQWHSLDCAPQQYSVPAFHGRHSNINSGRSQIDWLSAQAVKHRQLSEGVLRYPGGIFLGQQRSKLLCELCLASVKGCRIFGASATRAFPVHPYLLVYGLQLGLGSTLFTAAPTRLLSLKARLG